MAYNNRDPLAGQLAPIGSLLEKLCKLELENECGPGEAWALCCFFVAFCGCSLYARKGACVTGPGGMRGAVALPVALRRCRGGRAGLGTCGQQGTLLHTLCVAS